MKSILQDAQFAERKLALNSSAHAHKESRSDSLNHPFRAMQSFFLRMLVFRQKETLYGEVTT